MKYVFLSYSSHNTEQAEALKSLLQKNGIPVWIGNHDIEGGEDFSQSILDAISHEDCGCFVLLLTPEAQSSTWVPKELKLALSKNKPVVPVRMDESVQPTGEFELPLVDVQISTVADFTADDAACSRFVSQVRSALVGTRLPKLTDSNGKIQKWVLPAGIAVVAVIAAIGILLSSLLSQVGNLLGGGANNTGSLVPNPNVIDQIPEQYEGEIETAMSSTLTTLDVVVVDVGEYETPPAASLGDSYVYSQNTRVALGENGSIKGVSRGTTYIVVATKTGGHVRGAYLVMVYDPAAPLGENTLDAGYQKKVDALKGDKLTLQTRTHIVKVGGHAQPCPFSDAEVIGSTDTGVACDAGDGMVQGVTPGVAYVAVNTGLGVDVYRILVVE